MSYEILEKLKKEISGFKEEKGAREVGIVSEVGDGILRIAGLSAALAQELLSIEADNEKIPALAFNLEENFIGAVILGEGDKVRVGARVLKTGKVLSIKAGDELLGRVVDPLGQPLDGKGVLFAKGTRLPDGQGKDYFLERKAPSVIERESVNTPLHTGIKAIDAMIPIGRGQRELIIGDRQTGKTAIALDTILNQLQDEGRRQVISIYVAIGQKNSKIAKNIAMLEGRGAMKNTIVVSAPASAPASLQYLAPFAGAAIGEYFMDTGRDAVVIYDDLSKHADAYRQLSLLLRRPPGREAYPGDIFYLHARLLERAAKLSKEKGGGSLTALPIIETQDGDVSGYIPTNVISITDGQIFLVTDLFNKGVRPAIDVGISVSRVGSSAQTKAMKSVAGGIKLGLAQFRDLEAFMQFAQDLDKTTADQIAAGQRMVEVLKQKNGAPFPVEEQVVILTAANAKFFNNVPTAKVTATAGMFAQYMKDSHGAALTEIKEKGVVSDDAKKTFGTGMEEFRLAHPELFTENV